MNTKLISKLSRTNEPSLSSRQTTMNVPGPTDCKLLLCKKCLRGSAQPCLRVDACQVPGIAAMSPGQPVITTPHPAAPAGASLRNHPARKNYSTKIPGQ